MMRTKPVCNLPNHRVPKQQLEHYWGDVWLPGGIGWIEYADSDNSDRCRSNTSDCFNNKDMFGYCVLNIYNVCNDIL